MSVIADVVIPFFAAQGWQRGTDYEVKDGVIHTGFRLLPIGLDIRLRELKQPPQLQARIIPYVVHTGEPVQVEHVLGKLEFQFFLSLAETALDAEGFDRWYRDISLRTYRELASLTLVNLPPDEHLE